MSVEISLNTPLADALATAIAPKLTEAGWSGGADDNALTEYIVLMLVNGKTQDQIAKELAGELLGLSEDDVVVHEFAGWLFQQIAVLNASLSNGGHQPAPESMVEEPAGAGEMDTDMGANDVSELNV